MVDRPSASPGPAALLPPATIAELTAATAPLGPISDCQIVYWGLTDWEVLYHRPQIIADELSRRYGVLYLRYVPLSRLLRHPRQPLPPLVERLSPSLTLLRPRAFSPARVPLLARLNDLRATRLARAHLRPGRTTVLWLSHPDQTSQIGRYGERLLCFDSMDYHAGFKQGAAQAAMAAAELSLLRRADVVYTSGLDLEERAQAAGARPLLVQNAVTFERFARAAVEPLPLPPPAATIPRPRLLFYGTLGPWLDTDWLAALARQRPDWQLIIFGAGSGAALERLAGLPNVHQLGWQPYDWLPAYLQHADLCLLPFHDQPATRAMDPVKLYEYLAAGKPVVATPLPELIKWGDLVDLAPTAAAAIPLIERHLQTPESPTRRRQRLAAAAQHTWAARAATMAAYLEAALSPA